MMGIKAKISLIVAVVMLMAAMPVSAQRKITPINTAATATQPINELANDTARINARMRASMAHYHDENGNIVYIDTITGREWRDTMALKMKKPMQYPLLHAATVGVDIWNPLMRVFGQHYGLIDFMAQVSLHNRYKPTFETGLGLANATPDGNNFTYKVPMSVYFRLGLDYNFLYNSTPDYQFLGGIRFGFAPFKYEINDITIASGYWGEDAHPSIPAQTTTVAWWEVAFGLRVKIWGPISAGWSFRYHNILHEKKCKYGLPWYIPGYGTRGTSLSGSITISYTIPLSNKRVVPEPEGDDVLLFPETTGQPTPGDINRGLDAQNPE